MNRKTLPVVIACAVATFLSACSSGKPVTIAITTAPPATLEINNSASIAATVMHDSKDLGVDWTCSPSPCGSFNPAHTASGATTVWTAGSTAGSVTITAASTRKATVTATATVTVNAVATAANLKGNYVFYANGFDALGDYYATAGVVVLDGAGNVATGSEEDLNNTSYGTPVEGDALLGTYTVNSDGQGTMILNATVGGVADPLVGVAGTQTMSFVVVNSNHLLITEFDSAATSSGSMDFQTAAAITSGFSGNYAMTLDGYFAGNATDVGGVFGATGTGGTVTGTGDEDEAGTVLRTASLTGTIGATVDAMGRGTVTFGGTTFTYYIVGTEAVYMVEVDSGSVLQGAAFGQGSATFAAANVTGPYVLDEPWSDTASSSGPLALAGQFTADGLGTSATSISGVTDYNEAGFVDPGPGPDTLKASFTITATSATTNGYGTITAAVSNDPDFVAFGIYMVDPTLNINDPNNTTGGGGALIAEFDTGDLGTGFIVPQSATSLANANNGNGFAGDSAAGDLTNSTGQLVFASSGNFAGTENLNDLNPLTPIATETTAQAISGVSTADTTNAGRYTVVTTAGAGTANFVTYVASGTLSVSVDVDASTTLTQVGSVMTEGQQ